MMKHRKTAVVMTIVMFFAGPWVLAGDSLAVGVPGEAIGAVAGGGAVNVLYADAGGLTETGSQMWNQDSQGIPGMAEEDDTFGLAMAMGDFNGDGRRDLAIGVPYEDVQETANAGLVHVLFADGSGILDADSNQWWYEGLNGLPGTPAENEKFGASLAAGDFDRDGFADLAVGAPGEFEDGKEANPAGAVWVLYGSASGLTSAGSQVWTQDNAGAGGTAESLDLFGYSVAAGDFDGNGHDDLAIGVPEDEVGSFWNAGAVNVLYGSPDGLTDAGSQLWTDPRALVENAQFGKSLSVGDLDGDGRHDLAIGAPFSGFGGVGLAGTVTVLRGAEGGLSLDNHQTIGQGVLLLGWQVLEEPESEDRFGSALAFGDFNGDDLDDLAIAANREDVGTAEDAGVVHVLFGTEGGITGADDQLWHQDLTTVWGVAEEADRFGGALAAGDFDGDGRDDLAVGVPYECHSGLDAPGLVHIFYGDVGGPTSGLETFSQNGDVPGDPEDEDIFGRSLVVISSEFAGLFADGFETGDEGAWTSVAP